MEKLEQPYFDKKGNEIKEHALLKIFHFRGRNSLGRGVKNYYMYKWVKIVNGKYVALHLTDGSGDYFHLHITADKETRILKDTEIVQSY